MLAKRLIGIVAAVAMLSAMATAASAETVTGSGTIQTVTWSPSPPPGAITIPSGGTISLVAPGSLVISYNGIPVISGTAGAPTIKSSNPLDSTFSGVLTSYNIPYNGEAKVTGDYQWSLTLQPELYPGYSVTLGISGSLTAS